MRWAWSSLGFALCLVGCVSPDQERVRDYAQDGLHLFQRGDYPAARESFQAALALQPNDVMLLYNIGECYDRAGEATKAEQHYLQCLGHAPNHPDCRHAVASLLVRVGRRDDAVRMVQDWLAREPQLAAAYAEDGWLWYQAGDLPRAQARVYQALQLDAQDLRALIEMARIYEAMQRPDRALALYERVLERDPRQSEVVNRLNQLRAQGVGPPHPD